MIKEECGIFAVYGFDRGKTDVAKTIYYGLHALQHRGQESCGIAVNDGENITVCKNTGLVNDVFSEFTLQEMKGYIGIGHVRYSTCGGTARENAQPFSARYIKGTLNVAHNGNIYNASELRRELESRSAVFSSASDTEVIAYLIAAERLKTKSVEEATLRAAKYLKGSYSLAVMSPKKLLILRDPYGFRPLCMGRREDGYVFASETCALDAVRAEYIRDIEPGELVVAENGELTSYRLEEKKKSALCVFEHLYFARPDSVIDGQSVYEARIRAGELLAQTYPIQADIVIGVPDSGIVAAMGYSKASGIPYGEGFVKNRYIGRTFIQPTQQMREDGVRIKLNPISRNLEGKRVVMVDDSIVRGTTMRQIVSIVRRAGAKEVHVMISAPRFLFPCYYGTDIPSRENLASVKYTDEELRAKLGADSLSFLPKEKLGEIGLHSACGFCDGCFTGHYPDGKTVD